MCEWVTRLPLSFWKQHPLLIDVLCRRFPLADWSGGEITIPLDLCQWLFSRLRRQSDDLQAATTCTGEVNNCLQVNLRVLLRSAPLSFLVEQLRDPTLVVDSSVWNHWITRTDLPLSFFESHRDRIDSLDGIDHML